MTRPCFPFVGLGALRGFGGLSALGFNETSGGAVSPVSPSFGFVFPAFASDLMRYVGGVIGLSIGLYVKYQLDKKYVFVSGQEVTA